MNNKNLSKIQHYIKIIGGAKSYVDTENEYDSDEDEDELQLSQEDKNDLINAIPNNKYTKEEITKIIKYIQNNTITDPEEFPDMTNKYPKATFVYNAKKNEATFKIIKEKQLTTRQKEILEKKEQKKQAREEKERREEENRIAKEKKEEEKLKKLKPYYKADEPPKGYRRATMLEAVKNKKVLYWGRMKVDSRMIAEQFPKKVDPNYVKPLRLMSKIELSAENGKVRAQIMRLKKRLMIGIDDDVEKAKTLNEYNNLLKRAKDILEFLKNF